jgi:hypothetical protein
MKVFSTNTVSVFQRLPGTSRRMYGFRVSLSRFYTVASECPDVLALEVYRCTVPGRYIALSVTAGT